MSASEKAPTKHACSETQPRRGALCGTGGDKVARYLDPQLGRFVSRDPLGIWEDDLGSGHTYASGNPFNRVDPDGTDDYKKEMESVPGYSEKEWEKLENAVERLRKHLATEPPSLAGGGKGVDGKPTGAQQLAGQTWTDQRDSLAKEVSDAETEFLKKLCPGTVTSVYDWAAFDSRVAAGAKTDAASRLDGAIQRAQKALDDANAKLQGYKGTGAGMPDPTWQMNASHAFAEAKAAKALLDSLEAQRGALMSGAFKEDALQTALRDAFSKATEAYATSLGITLPGSKGNLKGFRDQAKGWATSLFHDLLDDEAYEAFARTNRRCNAAAAGQPIPEK